MTTNERKRLVAAITALAEAFGRQASAALHHGYELGLAGLGIAAIESAVARAMRECRFMPVPAELRELAGELPAKDRAIRAWSAAMRGIMKGGYYRSVNFDDPIINATIRSMGGWERFSERLEKEEEKWLRKDFEGIYVSFATRGVSAEACAPLGGFIARENHARGYANATPEPVLIACGLPPLRIGVVRDDAREPIAALTDETQAAVAAIGRIPD